MPLSFEIAQPRLMVWEIAEEEVFWLDRLEFSATMREEWSHCHPGHRTEWLATRWLAAELSGQNPPPYRKDERGKPWSVDGDGQFSFSHTRGWAAAMLSDRAVGVDVQRLEEKTLRIRHKFMLPEEIALGEAEPDNFPGFAHVHWCAREAVYKAHGLRGLDFRADILLEPFRFDPSGGLLRARTRKNGAEKEFEVFYRPLRDAMLAYATPFEMP
jgi:4'-phosphopantetheinyl transferase